MLGYAYQKGLVPVSAAAIEKAIDLNATQRNACLLKSTATPFSSIARSIAAADTGTSPSARHSRA